MRRSGVDSVASCHPSLESTLANQPPKTNYVKWLVSHSLLSFASPKLAALRESSNLAEFKVESKVSASDAVSRSIAFISPDSPTVDDAAVVPPLEV